MILLCLLRIPGFRHDKYVQGHPIPLLAFVRQSREIIKCELAYTQSQPIRGQPGDLHKTFLDRETVNAILMHTIAAHVCILSQ
jgi:hypothetical protein